MLFVACCFSCGLSKKTERAEMGYYTPYIKSSYITGGLRRQTVQDFLAAVSFVDDFKKFDQLYVFEQEQKEIDD